MALQDILDKLEAEKEAQLGKIAKFNQQIAALRLAEQAAHESLQVLERAAEIAKENYRISGKDEDDLRSVQGGADAKGASGPSKAKGRGKVESDDFGGSNEPLRPAS